MRNSLIFSLGEENVARQIVSARRIFRLTQFRQIKYHASERDANLYNVFCNAEVSNVDWLRQLHNIIERKGSVASNSNLIHDRTF